MKRSYASFLLPATSIVGRRRVGIRLQKDDADKRAGVIRSVLTGVCLFAIVAIGLRTPTAAAQGNPIVIENQQPGTGAWYIQGNTGSDSVGQIKAYTSATSVNKGQSITFHVSVNPAQTYTIDVYRLGWYQGLGGRLMQHIGPLNGTQQPTCPTDSTTGMIECQWAAGYTLATQTAWTSGVYLAVLTNSQNYQNYAHFVVRDDSRVAALMYQVTENTYQAYNDYPYDQKTGKSLYAFDSYGAKTVGGTTAAVKVSFDRPYNYDGDCGVWGYCILGGDVPFIHWLEKSGYDVTYSTDVDTHTNGATLLNYRGFISGVHDEYWSNEMYNNVLAARDGGVNIGFFSANAIYWQVRYESSSSSVPNRVLVCYRDATIDPETDSALKTINWRDPPVNRPEQTLIGVMYTDIVDQDSQGNYAPYVVTNSSNWVYAGTGFKDGDSVTGVVGYEADRLFSTYPGPTAVSGTYTLLSHSPFKASGASDYANSSIYQATSGAWVFASGTVNWALALDSFSPSGTNIVDPRLQQTTANILNQFMSNSQGNFTFAASPSSQTVTPGGSASYGLTITLSNGFTGQVTFSASGLPTGANGSFTPNPATSSSTLAVTTSSSTPPGTYTVIVTGVNGTLTYAATVTLVVGKATTTTTLLSSMNPSVSGKSVTFTAVVLSPASTPTGKVEYLNGATVLATVTLTSGSAKYTTSKLPAGSNSITAVYEGDSNNNSSTSAPVNQFVLVATTTTLTSSPNPSAYGQTVTFTAVVTSIVGAPPDGETVTFKQGTAALGTGTLSGGTATFSISMLKVGTTTVTAVYGGDSDFAGSTSKAVKQVVSKATTTTTLASSLNPSNVGQSVTFTANVTPQFSGTVTGKVAFYDGTTLLKTVALSGGAAECTASKLTSGTHTIMATYNGSTSFDGSSASLTQTVN